MDSGTPELPGGAALPKRRIAGRWGRLAKFLAIGALLGSAAVATSGLVAHRKCERARADIAAKSSFFDRHGQKIRYELKGEANPGPTVVLLSGFLGSLEQWTDAQEALVKVAPVLTYDRGGYGLSDLPPTSDADGQADELADLASMKSIKLPLVVVGFSSSALIARSFAKRHADLLGGIVLLDPTNPEQIVGVSNKDLYARRVIYERTPLLTLAKRLAGLQSGVGHRAAEATPAELRAAHILNFPSHWWAGYLEGKVIGTSAEEAQADWKNLHIPITLLSVAHPTGSDETRERYRLHVRFVEMTGAVFINPSGYNHDQVHGDNAFLPHIVEAVAGTVNRVRANTAASTR